ncbi:MAG: antitoxin family protein [Fimbriimonadales bacterium]
MQKLIRARYIGQAIVPDEPLDIPEGQRIEVVIRRLVSDAELQKVKAQEAWNEIKITAIKGLNLPDSALSREAIYED